MANPISGHHGGTHEANGDRHFAYVVVDSRAVTTGDCAPAPEPDPSKLRLTFIQECGVFTPLAGPWTAPAQVQFRLRNSNAFPTDYVLRQAGGGVGVKCLPTTPEPKIEVGDRVDGEFACDDTTVQQTRVVMTTTYVWDGDKFVGTTLQSMETQTRNLDADEIEECATEPPTTEPPTAQLPATQPPTVEPIVEVLRPFPSTPSIATQGEQLPATSAVSATELPATGNSAWSTILLALAALGAGAVFLRLSRRSV